MSVLEVARLRVREGVDADFRAAFAKAQPLIEKAEGHLSSQLNQAVGSGEYVLLVEWNALEDHTERFAASPNFATFRDLLWPYFEADPSVEHFAQL